MVGSAPIFLLFSFLLDAEIWIISCLSFSPLHLSPAVASIILSAGVDYIYIKDYSTFIRD
jgi:hypothetical protein